MTKKRFVNILLVVFLACNIALASFLIYSNIENDRLNIENDKLISKNDSLTFENDKLCLILSDNGISKKERQQIDVDYSESMSDTIKMPSMSYQFGDIWKDEMEKYLELLMEKLDDEYKSLIADSQERWETSAKADGDFSSYVYLQVWGPSVMRKDFVAIDYYSKYRERALYLKKLYDQLCFKKYDDNAKG